MKGTLASDAFDEILMPARLLSFKPSDIERLAAGVRNQAIRKQILAGFENALSSLPVGSAESVYESFCLGALLRSIWLKIPKSSSRVGRMYQGSLEPAVWSAFVKGFSGMAFTGVDERPSTPMVERYTGGEDDPSQVTLIELAIQQPRTAPTIH